MWIKVEKDFKELQTLNITSGVLLVRVEELKRCSAFQ